MPDNSTNVHGNLLFRFVLAHTTGKDAAADQSGNGPIRAHRELLAGLPSRSFSLWSRSNSVSERLLPPRLKLQPLMAETTTATAMTTPAMTAIVTTGPVGNAFSTTRACTRSPARILKLSWSLLVNRWVFPVSSIQCEARKRYRPGCRSLFVQVESEDSEMGCSMPLSSRTSWVTTREAVGLASPDFSTTITSRDPVADSAAAVFEPETPI